MESGFITLFNGRLNAESYIDILGENLLPSIDLLRDSSVAIFQQDNAPCHTAKKVKGWFEENKVDVMPWSANSPDLNCIENLWSWLDRQLAEVQISNLEQLKAEITKNLNNVDINIFHNLVESMPNRIQDCLEAKGGYTRYRILIFCNLYFSFFFYILQLAAYLWPILLIYFFCEIFLI